MVKKIKLIYTYSTDQISILQTWLEPYPFDPFVVTLLIPILSNSVIRKDEQRALKLD